MKSKLNELFTIMQENFPEETQAEIYGRIADELDAILAIREFNRFATEVMSYKDFRQVKEYAINDYFLKQTPKDREAIATSYARIERNTANRHDTQVVMDYWKACRREYGKLSETKGSPGGTSMA